MEYRATAGTTRGLQLRPAMQHWEPHDAPSVVAAGRTPSRVHAAGHVASPCGRALVRAARLKTK